MICFAIPNPPCSLNAFPSASDPNSLRIPESGSDPPRPSDSVIGFSNSFNICPSNSCAEETSRREGAPAAGSPMLLSAPMIAACISIAVFPAPCSVAFTAPLDRPRALRLPSWLAALRSRPAPSPLFVAIPVPDPRPSHLLSGRCGSPACPGSAPSSAEPPE